ncbi:MAG: IPT/TIG domain-containing protein, partial [bacterium]
MKLETRCCDLFAVSALLLAGCGLSVSSISPGSAPVGMTVTIAGLGFGSAQGSSRVLFDGIDAGSALAWSGASIQIAVPPGAKTGPVTVKVGSATSSAYPFVVSDPRLAQVRVATEIQCSQSLSSVGASVASQRSLALGDLNRDGYPDIVYNGGGTGESVCRYLGDASALFLDFACFPSGSDAQAGMAVGQFNGDPFP